MKISWRKLLRIHSIDWIWVACACDVSEENFHEWAQIREIREVFSLESSHYNMVQYPARYMYTVQWEIFDVFTD